MAKVIVSVAFESNTIRSVRVEQWKRGKKNSGDRTPRIINGATETATRTNASNQYPSEWTTRAFTLRGNGQDEKLHLRVVGYSSTNGTGDPVAVIAVPPRRHPKP